MTNPPETWFDLDYLVAPVTEEEEQEAREQQEPEDEATDEPVACPDA